MRILLVVLAACGPIGKTLIESNPSREACQTLRFGADGDQNDTLDDGEIGGTVVVCSELGYDHEAIEAGDARCFDGGMALKVGTHTTVLCSHTVLQTRYVAFRAAKADCLGISIGVDSNHNAIFDDSDVQTRDQACP